MKQNFRVLLGSLMAIVFGAGLVKTLRHHPATSFETRIYPTSIAQKPRFESNFVSSKLHIQNHAASIVELSDGRLRAFWFSGSREGAKDVQIRSSVFDPEKNTWSGEQVIATRESTEKSLLRYISKLGNPVCGRSADGKLWLYYVTVSIGGWSGSSITMKTSDDEGQTWSAARRIITSPFLNVSTLVKGTPFFYSDGSMGLPVYFELKSKFGEILHIDHKGNVIDLQRLSAAQDHGLQPVMLVKSPVDAQVLMRQSGSKKSRHVLSVATQDGGKTWTKPVPLSLSNPDAAVSAIVLPDQRILAVVNNHQREGISKGRDALELMISSDSGKTWKLVHRLEDQTASRQKPLNGKQYLSVVRQMALASDDTVTGDADAYAESTKEAMCEGDACGFEFSYPYLIQATNGDFHLVYTWNRSFIKYIRFNQAWIEQRLQK